MYWKIEDLAVIGIKAFLPQLLRGQEPRQPQDHRAATYRRKRTDEDGEIIWSGSSMHAYNLIKGLARPYVGAHTFLGDRRVRIWRAEAPAAVAARLDIRPGAVLRVEGSRVSVATGDGELTLLEMDDELLSIAP